MELNPSTTNASCFKRSWKLTCKSLEHHFMVFLAVFHPLCYIVYVHFQKDRIKICMTEWHMIRALWWITGRQIDENSSQLSAKSTVRYQVRSCSFVQAWQRLYAVMRCTSTIPITWIDCFSWTIGYYSPDRALMQYFIYQMWCYCLQVVSHLLPSWLEILEHDEG